MIRLRCSTFSCPPPTTLQSSCSLCVCLPFLRYLTLFVSQYLPSWLCFALAHHPVCFTLFLFLPLFLPLPHFTPTSTLPSQIEVTLPFLQQPILFGCKWLFGIKQDHECHIQTQKVCLNKLRHEGQLILGKSLVYNPRFTPDMAPPRPSGKADRILF